MGAEQKERSVAWPNHSNLFYTILLQAVFSIVHLLLVLCGDIEINPGPRLSESRSSPTHSHKNTVTRAPPTMYA